MSNSPRRVSDTDWRRTRWLSINSRICAAQGPCPESDLILSVHFLLSWQITEYVFIIRSMTFPGSNCLTNHHLIGPFSVLRARYPALRNGTIVPGASCAPYFLEVEIYDHRIWLYCIKVGVTLEDFAEILKHTSKTLLCRSDSWYHRQDSLVSVLPGFLRRFPVWAAEQGRGASWCTETRLKKLYSQTGGRCIFSYNYNVSPF